MINDCYLFLVTRDARISLKYSCGSEVETDESKSQRSRRGNRGNSTKYEQRTTKERKNKMRKERRTTRGANRRRNVESTTGSYSPGVSITMSTQNSRPPSASFGFHGSRRGFSPSLEWREISTSLTLLHIAVLEFAFKVLSSITRIDFLRESVEKSKCNAKAF